MRSLFLFLIILFGMISYANAKDADCEDKRGLDQFESCSQIIKTRKLYGKEISNNDLVRVYFNRGRANAYLKKFDEAISDFSKVIELQHDHSSMVYLERAFALSAAGKIEKAINDLNEAIRISPDVYFSYRTRGILHRKLKSFKKALDDFNQAILLYPYDADLYYQRAGINYDLNNFDKSLSDTEKALEMKPEEPKFLNARGVIYVALGRQKEALKDLKRAVELAPDNKEFKVSLEKLLTSKVAQTDENNKQQVTSSATKRIALVIGNDDYENLPDNSQLKKAQSDARSTAETFTSLGFDVVSGFNLKRRDMNVQLTKFANKINPGDEVMFFFAGHGVRIEGQNYLLPSDIPPITDVNEDLLKAESL